MKTPPLWMAVPLAAALINSVASAQHCSQGVYGPPPCEEVYRRNSMWPQQYIWPSRRGICQAFDTMIHNGWRHHNSLGHYHFDSTTGELNEAGRLKVEWTLTQSPPHRRTIYVERAADQEQTALRIAAVQNAAEGVSGMVDAADVRETYVRHEGRPAASVDAMFTGYRTSQPAPALPQVSTSSGQ